jgi:hypothetical protein
MTWSIGLAVAGKRRKTLAGASGFVLLDSNKTGKWVVD